MKGQWIGRNHHNSSVIILNMDEKTDCYDGYAFIHSDNNDLPRVITFIRTIGKLPEGQLQLTFQVLDKVTNRVENWEDVKEKYGDDVYFHDKALVIYKVDGFSMEVSWEDASGNNVSAVLTKTDFKQPSQLRHKAMNWDEFKAYTRQYIGKEFLFRGQSCTNRLRTSFHRAERCNFLRYVYDHVKELHWHISPKINHMIDLNTSEGLVSLLGIAQHHGYPTPLLDWTYSPYVAAYFAFCRSDCINETNNVRIYIFDSELWHTNMSRIESIWDPRLFVTVVKPLAIGNSRIVPQQATTTLTNVDDVESYIIANQLPGCEYLHAIDIPMSERKYVMADLRFMGITAGSLFPGLDGSCEELREKHFTTYTDLSEMR